MNQIPIRAGFIPALCCTVSILNAMPVDLSGVHPGPVRVQETSGGLTVNWPDEKGRAWSIEFRTDGKPEVIRRIALGDKTILEEGQPVYFADTGVRRGGWDQFFDFPPSHPDGIRRFQQVFEPTSVKARSEGDRVAVEFDGLKLGIFAGSVVYTIYPGSRLIQQEAVLTTSGQDVAYFYDAGFDYQPAADRRPGNNMETYVTYYDPAGPDLHTVRTPVASERNPLAVRYRALAARLANGSLAVFPPPHQYFFARDYTTNMGYMWQRAWRGHVRAGNPPIAGRQQPLLSLDERTARNRPAHESFPAGIGRAPERRPQRCSGVHPSRSFPSAGGLQNGGPALALRVYRASCGRRSEMGAGVATRPARPRNQRRPDYGLPRRSPSPGSRPAALCRDAPVLRPGAPALDGRFPDHTGGGSR